MPKLFTAPKPTSNKPDCESCQLCTVVKSPCLKFLGEGKTQVLIIGTAPSTKDDDKGDLGHGTEYSFLQQTLEDMGYDLERDFYYTTIVGCKLPHNRAPTKKEIKQCSPRIKSLIKRLEPKALLLLGESAFDGVIGERISGRLTGTPAAKFYGTSIPDQEYGLYIHPTYSTKEMLSTRTYDDGGESKSYYLRDNAVYMDWKNSITNAVESASKTVKIIDYTSSCKTTQDIDQAIDWVCEAMDWEYVAWDIEASGLKPDAEWHEIVCMSISNGKVSYSFQNFNDATFQKAWKKLLNSSVKKIAHNLQYENIFTKTLMGYWVQNWTMDTMLAQHVLKNNKPTGLKYCTYIEFGVIGYDEEADSYIKAPKEDEEKYGCNAKNRIKEAPIEELLLYNAMDSLFTYKLFEIYRKRATEKQLECIKLYTDTAITFSKMTHNGFHVDSSKFQKVQDDIGKIIEEKRIAIMASPDVALWDGEEEFNFNSTIQLGHLLFDIMKIKPIAYTETGKPSLDKEAMEKMNTPLLNLILEYREWSKMYSTYVDGWKRECVNDIVHSQFTLNIADTGRGSSNNPNSQNSYKRDKNKKKITRSMITPRHKGWRIGEKDYHGQETYMTMFYSNDPSYKRYLTDPNSDLHSDFTSKAFFVDRANVPKEWRQACKTAVFALAYGSYYKQIAVTLWEFIQKTPDLKTHMVSKGFSTYEKFELHAQELEKYYWTDMFGVHDKWRKQQWKEYQKKGYLESYTGFRLNSPMVKNATMNYAPQGSGSQCTFWTLNHIQADIEKYNKKTMIIGYIHDSMIFEYPVEEEAWLDERVWYYATQAIQEEWKWISIPLVIEKERSAIDGSWAEMYNCGKLTGGYAEPLDENERKL